MNRNLNAIACTLMGIFMLSGCVQGEKQDASQPDTTQTKVQIIATLFPQYDFARTIAGERAEISLLMPPGIESHSYEPSPVDIIRIDAADLFLYTGAYMEPWAQSIIDGVKSDVNILDVSTGIALEEDTHGHTTQNVHTLDPHVWTSPINAKKMTENILEALCKMDPEGDAIYRENAKRYLEKLDALDASLRSVVENGKRREIVFAGRFAFHYFVQEYGISYISAYDSCSSETEPSARAVSQIIDRVRTGGIPAIYYEEMVDPKVARSIAAETGAEILLLHSCHNVSRDEMKDGVTYLSLMEQNAKNLTKGLN